MPLTLIFWLYRQENYEFEVSFPVSKIAKLRSTFQTGEMAQWIKHLSREYEDQGLDPRIHIKAKQAWQLSGIPALGRQRIPSAGWLVQNWQALVSVRDPALVNRMEPLRDADVNFRHTLQTCTFMYTHTEALCPLKERTERIKGFC